ncbi:SGNH/GDSL hydrolase family protein [Nonomuraea sp. NPDC050536]|uniref:SGNH/GDSL hydrolase family protein n=1 Tax=Nonomuraea sp. NPDC050536 TaxID=3364366 RepID=UPI0037C5B3A4
MNTYSPGLRIVCLGDSITRAQVSADYLAELRRRRPKDLFVNAGVNGDLAYNGLRRLDAVIAEDPDAVTVLLGTNDVNASMTERNVRMFTRMKKLPARPTIAWYRENLTAIARRLLDESHARIGLLSPPTLGEDPDSPSVRRSIEYAEAVREVAKQVGITYLPLNERQLAHLRKAGHTPKVSYRDGRSIQGRAATQHFLLGRSFDAIARSRRLELTTDLVHQNSRGAGMIADLIDDFLGQP